MGRRVGRLQRLRTEKRTDILNDGGVIASMKTRAAAASAMARPKVRGAVSVGMGEDR